jgi:glycosyltransferase involved in cell wall biosynthesis
MHILVMPYSYPSKYFSNRAVFISDQVDALRSCNHKVGVLGCIPKTLTDVVKSRSLKFGQLSKEKWLLSIPAVRGGQCFNELLSFKIGQSLFRQYLKSEGMPDIVHVHNASAGRLALWIKRVYRVPFVITEHSSLMWSSNELPKKEYEFVRQLYSESHCNIAVSKAFANHLSSSFQTEFKYVANVVDTAFFVPIENRKDERSSITIVSVGNLTSNKNHILLIRAVSDFILEGGNVKVVIIGDGPEKAELEKQIKLLKLDGVVTLTGGLPRQDVVRALQHADFFVLPSLKETFGVVLIEAMSCGLPVFALRNGGSESVIIDKVGMLAGSSEDFIATLPLFLQKQYDNSAIREYAEYQFSSRVIARKLIESYL